MTETISQMTASELAIVAMFLFAGIAIGFVVSTIRHSWKAFKFKREEKKIDNTVAKLNLYKIGDLAAAGQVHLDPAMNTLLRKIHKEVADVTVEDRDPSEIGEELDDICACLKQLANA